MLWLAKQGLVSLIAISSLIVLIALFVVKVVKAKGDDAMENRNKSVGAIICEFLFTMSSNLAGGALLAKAHYN